MELFLLFCPIPDAVTVMSILKDAWQNTPRNWVGADPCGGKWEGISCYNSRVTSM
jgi:hypothetical protein